MKRKLTKFTFIILGIITIINIILYKKFNIGGDYNDIFYIIDCVLCIILGGLMVWNPKYFCENHKWGFIFLGAVVLVRGIVNLLLKLIYPMY